MSDKQEGSTQNDKPATNKPVNKPTNIIKPNTQKPGNPNLKQIVEKTRNTTKEKR